MSSSDFRVFQTPCTFKSNPSLFTAGSLVSPLQRRVISWNLVIKPRKRPCSVTTGNPPCSVSRRIFTILSRFSTSRRPCTGVFITSLAEYFSRWTGLPCSMYIGEWSRNGIHFSSSCEWYIEWVKKSPTHLANMIVVMMRSRNWISFVISTIMTASDMVSLDTPAKNETAPRRANAPGSIQSQVSVLTPKISTVILPSNLPYRPPGEQIEKFLF